MIDVVKKGTTKKISSQGGFFIFLRPLMSAGFTINEKCTDAIS